MTLEEAKRLFFVADLKDGRFAVLQPLGRIVRIFDDLRQARAYADSHNHRDGRLVTRSRASVAEADA